MTAAIKAGDALVFVRDYHYGPGNRAPVPVRVLKVGRRWVTVGGAGRRMRFAVDDPGMEIDGAGCPSPGRCWPSESAYADHQAAVAIWGVLRARAARAHPPAGVTAEHIAAACALLGLQLHTPTGESS